jgi:hypothetical protein
LIESIEKYNITAENLYNWDEKGFLIGQASATKRIMTREALEKGRITAAAQDGSREFMSLLACISADETCLPPALIYKGDSHDLQSTWVDDLQEGEEAYFAASSNGWSCDALGQQWLEMIFNRHTSMKSGNRRRLLLVDGHSSHVNMKFLNFADSNRILVLILPPHSTHRLQPLDVGLFSPLATAYTNELNKLMYMSLGMISMSKRMFWPLFRASWRHSFTASNIASAFAKTGIFPYNPDVMLKVLAPTEQGPEKDSDLIPPTPMTSRAIRRLQKSYKNSPTERRLDQVFRASERLAAQHAIDIHEKRGLVEAFRLEKQKRSRGKRLNLLGEDYSGPQFFSPSRIKAAQAFQAAKETAEQQRKIDNVNKKQEAAAARQQRDTERKEHTRQRKAAQQVVREEKARKAAEKKALRELKKLERLTNVAEKATKKRDNVQTQRKRANIDMKEDEGGRSRKRRKTLPTMASRSCKDGSNTIPTTQPNSKAITDISRLPRDRINPSKARVMVDPSRRGPITNSRGRRVCLPQRYQF